MIPIITEFRYLLSMATPKERKQFVQGATRAYDMRRDAPGVAKAMDSAKSYVSSLFAPAPVKPKTTDMAPEVDPVLAQISEGFNKRTGGDPAYRAAQAKAQAEAAKAAQRMKSGYDSSAFDAVPDDMGHANYQRQKR